MVWKTLRIKYLYHRRKWSANILLYKKRRKNINEITATRKRNQDMEKWYWIYGNIMQYMVLCYFTRDVYIWPWSFPCSCYRIIRHYCLIKWLQQSKIYFRNLKTVHPKGYNTGFYPNPVRFPVPGTEAFRQNREIFCCDICR